MITLFIDTNVLLSFYHLSSDDIEELKKLVALVENNQVELIFTEQVRDELKRNRSGKIADALRGLRAAKFELSYPVFAKSYEEYKTLRELLKKADQAHSELLKKIDDDAESSTLSADPIVSDLFAKARVLEITDDIYLRALRRVRLGNPPGKEQSLGDAVNWEALLENIPKGTSIYLVSGDKDFQDQRIRDQFNQFLNDEWVTTKASTVLFYTKISDFFADNYPDIKIASEVAASIERNLIVDELEGSRSFAQTHGVIDRLEGQAAFSPMQVRRLLHIAKTNSQVSWILSDRDVHTFYTSLANRCTEKLDKVILEELEKMLAENQPPPLPGEEPAF